MKKIVALLAMTVLSGQAFAADAIISAPEPVLIAENPVFNWTGGYIGAHAGYGWGRSHDVNNTDANEQKTKGGFGGIQAGYNWQFDNNIVLGAEADVSFGSIKKNWDGAHVHDPYYGSDKIGTNGTVRARLGYAVDRFLPYVTGGYAWADTKYSLGCHPDSAQNGTNGCKTPFEDSNKKTVSGYTVGAGLEYAMTDNWTVKGEYLYKNFGKNKVSLVDANYPNASTRNFKTHVNEIRLGVNYKF